LPTSTNDVYHHRHHQQAWHHVEQGNDSSANRSQSVSDDNGRNGVKYANDERQASSSLYDTPLDAHFESLFDSVNNTNGRKPQRERKLSRKGSTFSTSRKVGRSLSFGSWLDKLKGREQHQPHQEQCEEQHQQVRLCTDCETFVIKSIYARETLINRGPVSEI